MEIQLVIKAPNQNIDDQVVVCNLDWTVQKLKCHLSEVYPSKPIEQEQKLIYSGRLLHDHLHLKDILRHEDGQYAHILHLVCNEKNSFELPQKNSSSSHEPVNQAQQMPLPDSNTSSADMNARPAEENVLRHRNVPSTPQINNAFPPLFQPGNMQPTAFPMMPNDPQFIAQMAAMQQMYAYYMTQYFQSANSALPGSSPIIPSANTIQPQPNNQNQVPNETPAQRPANQRMNAQGGQLFEDNDELGNRDWLDHLFLCARRLILFSIIYYYSTPERLMIVVVCAIIAFLYHEGWFVRRPAPPAVVQDAPVGQLNRPNPDASLDAENNVNPPPPNQNLVVNEELQDGHEIEAAMDGDDPPHAQNADIVNNNQIFSPLTFLTAFFSSLIPDPPPPVNIN